MEYNLGTAFPRVQWGGGGNGTDPYTPPDAIIYGGLTPGVGEQIIQRGQPYGEFDAGSINTIQATNRDIYGSRSGIQGFDAAVTYIGGGNLPPIYTVGASQTADATHIATTVTYPDATHVHFSPALPAAACSFIGSHKNMWLWNNSLVPGATNGAAAGLTPNVLNYTTTTDATPISADCATLETNGWSQGGTASSSGAVPGTAYDTQRSQYTVPTLFFGTPQSVFLSNRVLSMQDRHASDAGDSMTDQFNDNETDYFDYGTKDYAHAAYGWTETYRRSALCQQLARRGSPDMSRRTP